ncbi:hypothetical protein E1176_13140 [Fulvivirga sp. RKSG066]|uniref:T9SS type B sorting domain-containing protein n=1 Tax=Fulvivirga aurantia TaxID=2529383 RepID=UPI0012BD6E49|nr:gliding motility-associated C-terminal domain-containing protein [Fulvivirga aurantia]MTI21971.1 hypothetical protein [Fulvivirga aurantia]
MKRLLLTLPVFLLMLMATSATAQEACGSTCGDGIDNDGDGFIDCFDSDCASCTECDGFYTGNDASCEATPSEFPAFSLAMDFSSPNKTANHIGRIAIGDLDRDGIPEIATQNRYTDEVYILNGNDGSVKAVADVKNPRWRISMANVEDDNCGEVYAIDYEYIDPPGRNNAYREYRIVAMDCNLDPKWTSEAFEADPVHLGYADFDRDGQPEMYYKDEIRDPVNGTRLVAGNDGQWNNLNAGPVAVDILGDEDLELVSGGKIYSVNLGSRTADAGNLTEIASMPIPYAVKHSENSTSVADYNLDGFLDVIASGEDANGVTTVFFWDVQNNTVKTFSDPLTAAETGNNDYLKGWRGGTGRLNIGDLDGDGQLNVSFVSGRYLYALDENFEIVDGQTGSWRVVINEETSGYTGCTLFDFNGDGQMEVVYRDEQWLYIIKGEDGSVFTQQRCISRTNVEYPIVADVDADGSTEICVPCGTDDADAWANFNNLSYSENSQVRVFKSGGEPWVPARRLWNQHGYFNVNVNDDLSIPVNQQKHHLVWSTGSCTQGPNRPLNGFLNQSPFLNSEGCPTYAAPDLAIVDNSLVINQPDCPDTDFTVTFEFENIGDVELTGNVPVSFYEGDPTQPGAIKLGTETLSLNRLGIGQVQTALDLPVTGSGNSFTLFVVLNDAGTTVPTPISLPNTDFLECDYGNNIESGDVIPNPFALSAEKTDNIVCSGASVPPNGSARAFRFVGGVENTTDYDFYWFNGTSASGAPDYTGAIYSGLAAGTYSVYATHKTAHCNSDTVQVVIVDVEKTISAVISVDNAYNNCQNPNGQLSVSVNGGEPASRFNYEWYEGNTVGGGAIISKSHIASNLEPIVYTVLVVDKATGCQTIESIEVPDEAVTPVVNASAVDIICSDANSGSVSADVAGSTSGFTFAWYRGTVEKPTADFTGSTVNSLPKGQYTVIATNSTTQCASAPVTVTIDQTTAPTISSTSNSPMTSCDSSQPNGAVSVSFPGNPSDFTIEWFAGANTSSSVIGTTATLNNRPAGVYTVRLTNADGCSVAEQTTVASEVVVPNMNLSAQPVTTCSPFDGTITVNVDVDSESDYTFSWYNGSSVKATPDYTETGNVLSNLVPGFYTVQAFHNTRNCLANSQTIEVIDNATVNITQTDAIVSVPNDCNTNDGALAVTVNSPGNASGFLIEWYAGSVVSGSPFFSENGVNTSQANNLTSGLYTVVATDLDNGCSNTEVFDLPYADAHQLSVVNVVDATTCNPNNDGSIEVQLTPTPLAGFDESNYTINLYAGSDVTVAPIATQAGVAGTTNYPFPNLASGNYTIEALADASLGNCTVLVVAEVDLVATDPVLAQTSVSPNVNCSGATGTGAIEVEVDGGANPANFTFNWYEGSDTSADPLGTTTGTTAGVNGEIADDLVAGTYTVAVLNIATQCSAIATYSVVANPTTVSIASADLSITPWSSCTADLGAAEITNILENGSNGNLIDYDIEWLDANQNLLPNPAPETEISNLTPGIYFVRASNAATGCAAALHEFEIEDTTVEPSIILNTFNNPERCESSDGSLFVEAVGPSSYTYQWYDGTDNTGTLGTAGQTYASLGAGFYTIEVEDTNTGCLYYETYELELQVNPVVIVASATPVTNCDSPDGSAFAVVTSDGTFDFTWRNSSGAIVASTTNSGGTASDALNLPEGVYTVTATDRNDSFCENSATVTITNEQITPNLVVEELAPMTVCDDSKANGVARATVEGGFVGYRFDWFAQDNTTNNPNYTGVEFSGLQAGQYRVIATDLITFCTSTQTVDITENLPQVSDPTVLVLSHDTHCTLDIGQLQAHIDGNTSNYTFDWYMGSEVRSNEDFTGEIISDLAAGQYTVVATSLITGCVSNPVTTEVLEILEYPEMEFEIGNASCGTNDGFALMRLTNDVEVESIVWTGDNLTSPVLGPNLTETFEGLYTITITTALGCEVTEEVEIKTEVNPFNGISRGNGGQNDFFKIDCISSFPENVVKIFNRAGTLVYETQGYDNASKLFDGVSNKGMSPIGTDLPDGTYFYVIDKNDGSKPLSGYLEIVN